MMTTDEELTVVKIRSVLLDAIAAFARGDELRFEAAMHSARTFFGAEMITRMRETAIKRANAISADKHGQAWTAAVLAWIAVRRKEALQEFRERISGAHDTG